MLKLVAFFLTGDAAYAASARNDLHYLLGRNATGYCFVTGYGSKSPRHPHNRIMAADGVDEPIPGFLVGGPNTVVLTDCEPENVVRSNFPAASYTDTQCSYSTNETAINWNAPLVFLSSGISSLRTN
jgi:endoglucanase